MPSPLENILQDMWRAFDAKLYYPALLVALTLPEVCSGLALKNSDFIKQKHYVDFIEKYAENLNLGVSGPQCYQLRGGVVHRANAAAHPHFDATHVIFTVPETGLAFHSFSILSADESEKATMIDLRTFCTVMDAAVRNWFAENGQSTQVAANISSLISWRPDGILPFADGAPWQRRCTRSWLCRRAVSSPIDVVTTLSAMMLVGAFVAIGRRGMMVR